MKVIFELMLFGAVAGYFVYEYGFSDFDPDTQAADFNKSVTTGMSWVAVVDLYEPKKYRVHSMNAMGGTSSPMEFKRDVITKLVADGKVSIGFQFNYFFSAKHSYSVLFDGEGVVTSIIKERTAADLFQ